jgi:hypothetical protein
MCIWIPCTIHHHLNVLPSTSPFHYYPPAHVHTHCTCFTDLFLLLIFNWFSKEYLNVCPLLVYFTLVHLTPSITLPYPFTSHIQFFKSFQYTSLYLLPSHLMLCDIIILFSFSSFPEFHEVVPLLQTCSTPEFVYDYPCFCLYVYLWIYLQHMRENVVFVFLILA